MPQLAAFPKCYMDELCVTHSMTVFQWIDLAASLPVDGVELYDGFFREFRPPYLQAIRAALEEQNLQMPMMCYSPDFTIPDPAARQIQVDKEKRIMEVTAILGGKFCRVLSGQRYPGLDRREGLDRVVACIEQVLPVAAIEVIFLAAPDQWNIIVVAAKQKLLIGGNERARQNLIGVAFKILEMDGVP